MAAASALSAVPVARANGAFSEPFVLSRSYPAGSAFQGIRLLGALRLTTQAARRPHQLSGLTWDADEGLLYAVSDDGYIAHIEPHFTQGLLSSASLRGVYDLRDAHGEVFDALYSDAEGLSARCTANHIRGDTDLLVSFETTPRVAHFRPDGTYLGEETLAWEMTQPFYYAGSNLQLEGIAESPHFGTVVAVERPLKNQEQTTLPLISLAGLHWRFPPVDAGDSALVGLEAVGERDLLVLERRYSSPFMPFSTILSQVTLSERPRGILVAKRIVQWRSNDGWALDNFEGLTRHTGNRYFMISDDNRSLLQSTILVYFEVLDAAPAAADAALSAPAGAASTRPGYTGGCGNRADAR